MTEEWQVGYNMFRKGVEMKIEEVTYQTYLFDRLLMSLSGKVMSFAEYKNLGKKESKEEKSDEYYANIAKRAKQVFA